MKTTSTTSRLLLGLVFTVFGLNGFLNFFSTGPVPPLAGQFFGALVQSHYMSVVFAIEIICGLALLANWKIPLALTILGARRREATCLSGRLCFDRWGALQSTFGANKVHWQ